MRTGYYAARTRTFGARLLLCGLLSLLAIKQVGCSTKQLDPLPERSAPLPTAAESEDYRAMPGRPGVYYCDRLVGWAFPSESAEVRAEDQDARDE